MRSIQSILESGPWRADPRLIAHRIIEDALARYKPKLRERGYFGHSKEQAGCQRALSRNVRGLCGISVARTRLLASKAF